MDIPNKPLFGEKKKEKSNSLLPTMTVESKKTLRGIPYVVHGAFKAGKSTFCATFPKKILFLDTDKGLNYIDGLYLVSIDKYSDFLNIISELEKGTHDFSTIVLDTVDRLIQLCKDITLEEFRAKSKDWTDLEHDCRKSYPAFRSKFRYVIDRLMSLCSNQGLTLVLVCHSFLDSEYNSKGEVTSRQWRLMFDKPTQVGMLLGMVDQIFFVSQEDGSVRITCHPSSLAVAGGRPAKHLAREPYPANFDVIEADYNEKIKEGK